MNTAAKKETPASFIKANAVLLSSDDIKRVANSWFTYPVWYLTNSQANHLMSLVNKEKAEGYNIGSNTMNDFITSYDGLIMVGNQDIPSKNILMLNGHKVLRMEVSRDQWFVKTSRYAKQIAGVFTEDLVAAELSRIQRFEEERTKKERLAKQQKDTFAKITAAGPNTTEFSTLVQDGFNFDHWYGYIENADSYRFQVKRLEELQARFTAFGLDGVAVMKEIMGAHY